MTVYDTREHIATNWPACADSWYERSATDGLLYDNRNLLIGPLRMERQSYKTTFGKQRTVWVYCWNDPGVKERVREEVNAIEAACYDRNKL